MAIPQTRADLRDLGYIYSGEGVCGTKEKPGCGAVIFWFVTPKNKKNMPMSVIAGTEHEPEPRLEPHWGVCPQRANFKKDK